MIPTSSAQPVIELKLEDMRHLHDTMIELYPSFVGDAPADWKTDQFLEGNVPIVVTSRFGQNQLICAEEFSLVEAENWYKERHWNHISRMTFAIATDITCVSLSQEV
jgi:hypothetical protein